MELMFNGCEKLISLDLRNFDTRNVSSMTYMFLACFNLKAVVFGKNFSMGNVNSSSRDGMFSYCRSLRYVDFYLSDDTDAINSSNVARR